MDFSRLKCQLKGKKIDTVCFGKISQVLADEWMGKKSKLVKFSTQKLFQIRACVMGARKVKHLDVTTMFTYSAANTPLSQSARVYYLTYLIKTTQ